MRAILAVLLLSFGGITQGSESVVAKLWAEKKLSVHLSTSVNFATDVPSPVGGILPPAVGFRLLLVNDSNETLPGWELNSANSVTTTLYRVEAGGEVKVAEGQWALFGGLPDSPSRVVIRDAPVARIPPGSSVKMGMQIPLSDGRDPEGVVMQCGRNGVYRLVFRLTTDHSEIVACRFHVSGDPQDKVVEIEL